MRAIFSREGSRDGKAGRKLKMRRGILALGCVASILLPSVAGAKVIINVGGSRRDDGSVTAGREAANLEGCLSGAETRHVANHNCFNIPTTCSSLPPGEGGCTGAHTGWEGGAGNASDLSALSSEIASAGVDNIDHITCFSQGCAMVAAMNLTNVKVVMINPAIAAGTPITGASNITVYRGQAPMEPTSYPSLVNPLWTNSQFEAAGATVREYDTHGVFHDQKGAIREHYADSPASCPDTPAPPAPPTGDCKEPNCTSLICQAFCGVTALCKDGPVFRPIDPNQMIGPVGVGTDRAVPGDEPLAYQIEFENQATANATVQEVAISNSLSPYFDWSTLKFTSVIYGGRRLTVPAGANSLITTDVPVNDGCVISGTGSLAVKIALQFDSGSGVISLGMQVIDPTTGTWPADAAAGILPPGNSTCATGFVEYSVQPLASLASGTVITNQASIVFDANDPIVTNTVSNTIAAP